MLAAAQGHQAAVFILGDENDLDAPMVLVLKMPEGFVAPRHSHGCHRLELVIEGEHIRNDGTVLGAGDIATSGPNENYGPFLVGKGGSYSIEIFAKQSQSTPVNVEKNEMTAVLAKLVEDLNSGAISPEELATHRVLKQYGESATANTWDTVKKEWDDEIVA